MLLLSLACAEAPVPIGPLQASDSNRAPTDPPERSESFAVAAPVDRDLVLIVDPAFASDPGLQAQLEAVLAVDPALRLAVASMVAGSVPAWVSGVDWEALTAATGPLRPHEVALSTPGLAPGASVQVVFATAGPSDPADASLEDLLDWLVGADPRLSAAHVVVPCDADPEPFAAAVAPTGGWMGTACDDPKMLANLIARSEWGYPLRELPVPETLRVHEESRGGFIVGFAVFDPETGTGDWTYEPRANVVQFVSYVQRGTVFIGYDVGSP